MIQLKNENVQDKKVDVVEEPTDTSDTVSVSTPLPPSMENLPLEPPSLPLLFGLLSRLLDELGRLLEPGRAMLSSLSISSFDRGIL